MWARYIFTIGKMSFRFLYTFSIVLPWNIGDSDCATNIPSGDNDSLIILWKFFWNKTSAGPTGSEESHKIRSYLFLLLTRNLAASSKTTSPLGLSKPRLTSGKNLLQTSTTILSISTTAALLTSGCLRTSLRVPPSPPPIISISFGLGWTNKGTCESISWYINSSLSVIMIEPYSTSTFPNSSVSSTSIRWKSDLPLNKTPFILIVRPAVPLCNSENQRFHKSPMDSSLIIPAILPVLSASGAGHPPQGQFMLKILKVRLRRTPQAGIAPTGPCPYFCVINPLRWWVFSYDS